MGDLVHVNKDLEDELTRSKVKVNQQCDETAKEALRLACRIF